MSRVRGVANFVLLVQIQGPDIMPFTLEKENLILGLWQLQQAGQDLRIKEVSYFWQSKLDFCPYCCFPVQQPGPQMDIPSHFQIFNGSFVRN